MYLHTHTHGHITYTINIIHVSILVHIIYCFLIVSKNTAATTFVSFFAKLRDNVNPDDISAHLFARNVITNSEKAEGDHLMYTQQVRMDKLLAAVQKAIEIDSQNYETFLDILGNEGKYAALVKEMRSKTTF